MYILLNNINIFLPQCLPCLTQLLFWRVAVNTFTVLFVYEMMLVLLKSTGEMLMKWLSDQFWRCCSCMSSFSETADAEVTASITRYSLCSKQKHAISSLLCTHLNRSRGCQTLINLRRITSSWTHLVLQACYLADVDEINPLGIEIWYRTKFFETRWYRGNSVGA